MGNVRSAMCMSLDGVVGGIGDEGWPVHERVHGWKFPLASFRQRIGMEGGDTNASSQVIDDEIAGVGAYVMGRNMFDAGEDNWGEEPPFHAPVFVLTNRDRPTVEKAGGTSYVFVGDGIEKAVDQARAAAGEKDVFISGGASAVQQTIAAGLLDEIEIHLVPVVLGRGVRLFDNLDAHGIELVSTRVIDAPDVIHLRYRVVREGS